MKPQERSKARTTLWSFLLIFLGGLAGFHIPQPVGDAVAEKIEQTYQDAKD